MTDEIHHLQQLSPQPIPLDNLDRRNSDLLPIRHKKSWLIPVLLKLQKYSALSFSVFTTLHVTSVGIAPLLSVDVASELFSMSRTIYHAQGLENLLVWGSLSVHLLSGMALRVVRLLKQDLKPRGRKPEYVNDKNDTQLAPEYGLGGISSFLGLGAKRSFVSRKLGLSPLSFSGYCLVPMVLYHLFHERVVPLLLDGDSSYVDLSFVAHALNQHHKWLSYVGFVTLVGVASYHITSGALKYLGFFSRKSRHMAYGVIGGVTMAAALSLANILKMGPAYGFMRDKFDLYLGYCV